MSTDTAGAVDRLSPADRIAVQDWIVRRYLQLRTFRKPERRKRWKEALARKAALQRKVLGVEPW